LIEERSIKRKKDKPDEKSDFRGIPKTNKRTNSSRNLWANIGLDQSAQQPPSLISLTINFLLLSQLHREHFGVTQFYTALCETKRSTSRQPLARKPVLLRFLSLRLYHFYFFSFLPL